MVLSSSAATSPLASVARKVRLPLVLALLLQAPPSASASALRLGAVTPTVANGTAPGAALLEGPQVVKVSETPATRRRPEASC